MLFMLKTHKKMHKKTPNLTEQNRRFIVIQNS